MTTAVAGRRSVAPPHGGGRRRLRLTGLAFLLPATVATIGVLILPLLYAVWTSLVHFNPGAATGPFVGVRNYRTVLGGGELYRSLYRTIIFAVPAVGLSLVLGFVMAMSLNARFPGRGLVRALLIVPWALGSVVTGLLWSWILNSSLGVLNRALEGAGLIGSPIGWLASPAFSPVVVAVVFAWSNGPLAAVLLLSALQGIPPELYGAARVDGAGPVRRLLHVTLPLLRSACLVVLVILTVEAFFTFGLVYVMTSGGPGEATTFLSWLGYTEAFSYLKFGDGTVVFFFLSACVVVAALLYQGLLHRSVGRRTP